MRSEVFGIPPDVSERFRTVELTATASYDAAALGRVMERAASARRSKAGPDSVRVYGASGDASGETWERHVWRFWWDPPSRWREELTWPGGQTTVIIARPDLALSYVSMHGTLYTTEPPAATGEREPVSRPVGMRLPTVADRLAEFPLINPRLPASHWELATLGRDVYLGRAVRRVRATRRASAAPADESSESSGYWPWLDEYECLVDDVLQILLRLTGVADGRPIATVVADQVRVDQVFSPDLFTFVAPPGTRVMHVSRSA